VAQKQNEGNGLLLIQFHTSLHSTLNARGI